MEGRREGGREGGREDGNRWKGIVGGGVYLVFPAVKFMGVCLIIITEGFYPQFQPSTIGRAKGTVCISQPLEERCHGRGRLSAQHTSTVLTTCTCTCICLRSIAGHGYTYVVYKCSADCVLTAMARCIQSRASNTHNHIYMHTHACMHTHTHTHTRTHTHTGEPVH